MSYDRKIDQVCPHLVAEEALFLTADRTMVRPLRPIASAASVQLRVNSEMSVPSFGHRISAQAKGAKPGPFTIQAGVNDLLLVEIDGGPLQTVRADPGVRVSPDRLVLDLNRKIRGAYFTVSSKRQLRCTTARQGKETSIVFKTGSTLAPILGLPLNRHWKGAMPVPGWSLIQDPNTLRDRPTRLVVFDTPLKGLFDFVEMTYTTVHQECRRCGGLGVENDWRYTKTGGVVEVRDEALLIQEILKISYTVQGSNPFHTWYGTSIIESVGKKIGGQSLIQSFIVADIYEAFRRWQNIKRQQEEVVGQVLSDEEYPFKLLQVGLEQSAQDPTIVFVNATIQSRSQKPIQIERGVKVPGPEDLLGSTAQQGVFRQSLSNFTLTG